MTTTRTPDATCPHCGEQVFTEYDPIIKRWVCQECGKSWPPTKATPAA